MGPHALWRCEAWEAAAVLAGRCFHESLLAQPWTGCTISIARSSRQSRHAARPPLTGSRQAPGHPSSGPSQDTQGPSAALAGVRVQGPSTVGSCFLSPFQPLGRFHSLVAGSQNLQGRCSGADPGGGCGAWGGKVRAAARSPWLRTGPCGRSKVWAEWRVCSSLGPLGYGDLGAGECWGAPCRQGEAVVPSLAATVVGAPAEGALMPGVGSILRCGAL